MKAKLFILTASLIFCAREALAGGAFFTVQTTGQPVKWKDGKVIVNIESEGFNKFEATGGASGGEAASGCGIQIIKEAKAFTNAITKTEINQMIKDAIKVWTDAAGPDLQVTINELSTPCNFSNLETECWVGQVTNPPFDPSKPPNDPCNDKNPATPCFTNVSADPCYNDPDPTKCKANKVFLDPVGEAMDIVAGECARFSLYAITLPLPLRDGTTGEPNNPDLKAAQMLLNGNCFEPAGIGGIPPTVNMAACPGAKCEGPASGLGKDVLQNTLVHEFGHWFGLDHAVVNHKVILKQQGGTALTADELELIPTMYADRIDDVNLMTLTQEDISHIRRLYKIDKTGTCTIKGKVLTSTSRGAAADDPIRCFEVVARPQTGPGTFTDVGAVGFVSGAECPRKPNDKSLTGCVDPNKEGDFVIPDLPLGKYYMGVHNFNGFNNIDQLKMEPCAFPPQSNWDHVGFSNNDPADEVAPPDGVATVLVDCNVSGGEVMIPPIPVAAPAGGVLFTN